MPRAATGTQTCIVLAATSHQLNTGVQTVTEHAENAEQLLAASHRIGASLYQKRKRLTVRRCLLPVNQVLQHVRQVRRSAQRRNHAR